MLTIQPANTRPRRRGKYRNYRPQRKRDVIISLFDRANKVVAAVLAYSQSWHKIQFTAASKTIPPDKKETIIVAENRNLVKHEMVLARLKQAQKRQ